MPWGGTGDPLMLSARAVDLSALASTGQVYAKTVSGKAELHYIDDLGNITQITSGGTINAGELGGFTATRIIGSNASGVLTATAFSYSATNLNILSDSGALTFGASSDAILTRDAANVLAQRNGTTAQEFRVYGTFTDASNYERMVARYSSSVFQVTTAAAGSGFDRNLILGAKGRTQIACNADESTTLGAVTLFKHTLASGYGRVGIGSATSTQAIASGGVSRELDLNATVVDAGTTSSDTWVGVYLRPTINMTAASRTGRMIPLYIAPTNTSLPTGNNGAIALSSTAADGLGGIQLYNTSDEATNWERGLLQFSSNVLVLDSTAGGSGTRRGIRIGSSGALVGFYDATPVAQQTGVAVTAAAIHAALVSLGLITA